MMERRTVAALPFDARERGTFERELRDFRGLGTPTSIESVTIEGGHGPITIPTFTNEFWTAKQRAAHSLHEVSYRACFKPQLPGFFIERLTRPGDVVYDPFMGRGTTPIEAALTGRAPVGCDINPLSALLCEPRLRPPALLEIERALGEIEFDGGGDTPDALRVFYHPSTLRQISALREHLLARERTGELTRADRWIRMVAINRLTGHSKGFFSVYTLPPNQAVSPESQARINARLGQTPEPRDVPSIILGKSRSLLRDVTAQTRRRLDAIADRAQLIVGASAHTPQIGSGTVALVVTSPPFLDVVNYPADNWLRCWFSGIDAAAVPVTLARQVDAWKTFVTDTLVELRRVVAPGGHVAFEVGEVRGGALRLEEVVIPAGVAAGLEPAFVLINSQQFTKTANCWGVDNNRKGTNTNRVVLFRRAA